jgi:antitoxin component YwqK of YwqJK toxin-antitoxin module
VFATGLIILISVLFLSGPQSKTPENDSLSEDEAVIALNINALHSKDRMAREVAAEVLRRTVAKYPGGTTNIRYKDGGENYWMEKINQVKEGMIITEVMKILQLPPESQFFEQYPNGDANYRLDNDWIVTIRFLNRDKVISNAKLTKRELLAYVTPPENYTGTWTIWYVNGQKGNEIEHENGRYNGLFTRYYDNGQKTYEQHHAAGVCDGPDTGWYRDGQQMYSGQYHNGRLDGKWVHWYANGQRHAEYNYKDGEYDGLIAGWYESGQIRFETNYKNGILHGCQAYWDEQGVLEYQRLYKNGIMVDERSCQRR